jgi:hypothetical protein
MTPEVLPTRNRATLAASDRMRERFFREVAGAGLPNGPGPSDPISATQLAALPPAAQRYLEFMGVAGRPRVWSFRARWTGLFRMRPDQTWMRCEAWQYNSGLEVSRIFHMRLRLSGLVPVLVRDTYVRGEGRMLARLFDRVTIADVADHRIDTGELVTFLNDAIMFAPSMLFGLDTVFSAVDQGSFDVRLADRGRSVQARVFVDGRGRVTDFSTIDRYGTDPARRSDMVRARWSTPIRGWKLVDGRPLPEGGEAVWHFPSGTFLYADFSVAPGDLAFDVAPGR